MRRHADRSRSTSLHLRAGAIVLTALGWVTAAPDAARAAVMCHGQVATIVGTPGADTLVGTDGADVIAGISGNDTIDGRGGDDLICAVSAFTSPGARVSISGGAGVDTLSLSEVKRFAQVKVDLTTGSFQVNNTKGTATEFENFIGSAAPSNFQQVTGTAGPNRIEIDNGLVVATLGGDTIVGVPSVSYHVVGVSYAAATSGMTVDLNAGTASGWTTDSLTGVHAITGSYSADRLLGSKLGDSLRGLRGADVIDGRSGNDYVESTSAKAVLRGGAGDDLVAPGPAWAKTVDGGLGRDMISAINAKVGVTIDLGAGTATLPGVAGVFVGFESAFGSNFADVLIGTNADNVLQGGDGDDLLQALGGQDKLWGDAGADSLDGGTGTDRCLDVIAETTFVGCETAQAPPD